VSDVVCDWPLRLALTIITVPDVSVPADALKVALV
jgi:hypothetical protein